MIAQLLNRKFILEQLQDIGSQLKRDVQGNRQGGVEGTEHLGTDDYQEALTAIQQTEQREVQNSSGQSSLEFSEGGRRGGEDAAPLDDRSFLSRDPTVNLLQSALVKSCDDEVSPAGQA